MGMIRRVFKHLSDLRNPCSNVIPGRAEREPGIQRWSYKIPGSR
jgi:hypothetical protein